MPKLKVFSAKQVQGIFGSFGFVIAKQKGSHIKFERIINGAKQTLTVPNHKEIDRGTLGAIFRQATRFIPEQDLRNHFYAE